MANYQPCLGGVIKGDTCMKAPRIDDGVSTTSASCFCV